MTFGCVLAIAVAVQGAVSASQEQPAPQADVQWPVSLSRIERALEQQPALKLPPTPSPATEPVFRVEVVRTNIESVLERLDFRAGPVPPGGLYGFEQKRVTGGNPWAGEPLVKVNVLPMIEALHKSVNDAKRARNERAAREQVRRELREFCQSHGCD